MTKKVSVEQFSEIYKSLSIKNQNKLVEYANELKKGLETYFVIGYTEINYNLSEKDENSDDFIYGITKRIKILLKHDTESFTLLLNEEIGSCPSGYCAASWGNVESFMKEDFVPEYIAKDVYQIKFPEYNPELDEDSDDHIKNLYKYKCEQFRWSIDGSDQWYPSGYVEITEDMFKPNTNFLIDEIVVNI